MKLSIVDYEERVEEELDRIRRSEDLEERDREAILRYRRDMEVRGLRKSGYYRILVQTRKCAEWLDGRALVDATEDDVKDLVIWVQNRDIAASTRSDYKKTIKRFFKWLNDGEYPDKVEWIKTTKGKKDGKLPENLLDEEDVQKLMDAARNLRNRALIAVIWETGARPGEYIDLKVGEIEDRKHGKKVIIDGKTGPRRLPLVSSAPPLNLWLAEHPASGDGEAPLWCRLDGHPHKRIDYHYFRKLLREIAERAGVEKPIYPYQFRHSRATYLANRLTEAQMCEYFGWVQGSDRPATYVHLSGRDIDVTYDKIHGLEKEERDEARLSPVECPRCGEMNDRKTNFCSKCGLPLEHDIAQHLQEDEEIAEELYTEDAKAEGGIRELVEEMVERRLKEILGEDYQP